MDDLAVIYKIIAGSFKVKENEKSGDDICAHWGLIHLYKLLPFQMNLPIEYKQVPMRIRDLAKKNLKVVNNAEIKDAFVFTENVTEVKVSENEFYYGTNHFC